MNGLKIINDSHGHGKQGQFAELQHVCGAALISTEKLYRIGGDEFVAVLFAVQLEQFLWIKTEFDGDRYWTGNRKRYLFCTFQAAMQMGKEIANVADIRM